MQLEHFRLLLPSMRGQRLDLALAFCAALGAQVTGILLPFIARYMVKNVFVDPASGARSAAERSDRLWWTVAGILVGLAVLRGFFSWQQQMRSERAAQGVLADIRRRMYEQLQRFNQGYFDRKAAGKILIRFIGDSNALRTWLARTILTVPADVAAIIIISAAIGLINVQLFFAAALPLLVVIPVVLWINPHSRGWTRAGRRGQTRLCGLLTQRVADMGVIQAYNAQPADSAEVSDMIEGIAAANVRRGRLDAWSQCFPIVAVTIGLGACILWGTRLQWYGRVNYGDLLAVIWLTLLLRSPVTRLSRSNVIHQRARVAVDRIVALLQRQSEPGWSQDLAAYQGPGRQIELRHIGYKDAARHWVLSDLNASIEGPGLVAITDEALQARTVLLELLLRLRRPHKGRIYLDGQDVRKLRVADIRRQMGWVDRNRRNTDVVSDLMRLESEVTRSRLWGQAWKLTEGIAGSMRIDELIHALSPDADGLTARSANSRENQLRISLCCALIYDPPILLIDEPTAELDTDVSQQLTDWLRTTAETKLVIVAGNDPLVTSSATQIVHLGRVDGKPVETDVNDSKRMQASDTIPACKTDTTGKCVQNA